MAFKSKQDLSALIAFHREVNELAKYKVRYGYFDEHHYSGLNMATLAAIHEQGWGNLPERNFIYSTQLAFRGDLNKHYRMIFNSIIGKKGFMSPLQKLGKAGERAIKMTIDTGHFSNNKVSQMWAGVKGFDAAMVHYGDLRAATTFKVSKLKNK